MPQLKELFQPLQIGKMEIKNRLTMSCMAAGITLDPTGRATPEMIAYFVERAKTGPGMMGIGAGSVLPPTKTPIYPLALHDDEYIDALKAFVDAVHQHDTKFGIQLWNGGIQGDGVQLSPSGIGVNVKVVGSDVVVPTVMSVADIQQAVQHFADGAERCAQAGFDFVEIHAGHGYLISTFMTPFFNRREDAYGGSFENRTRFLLEVLRAVKARVGDRITVGVKINGDDCLPKDGWTLDDACRIAPILQQEGADYLTITAGVMGSPRLTVPPMYEKQGCFADYATAIKQHVSIPVLSVGRIKSPAMANEMIKAGEIDAVAMGRPFIADPQIVEKARNDQLEDVRPCLADCRGCLDQQMRAIQRKEKITTSCIVNPRMGRELDCIDIKDAKKDQPRKVLVVGAGCSGMEAARAAAYAGHQVVLVEKRGWTGGQIRLAAMMPGRHEIGDILPWYDRQLAQLGVDVRLNTSADAALLDALKPDVVVVATGSLPKVPQDFLESLYNVSNIEVHLADEMLEEKVDITGKNIVVVGGEQIGMQLSDYLSEKGQTVTVVEEHGHFAQKMAGNDRWYLTNRIAQKGVKRLKNVSKIEVLPEDDVWLTIGGERTQMPGVDTIVMTSDRQPDRSFAEVAEKMGYETHVIGDASDVLTEDGGTIFSSLAQGYDLGRQL
ncbi:MAG TPA: FAD-dependent oxidoreductase [Macromonas sp.]|nr:FAD-dependent oxidoreductase [Macromonas sp.]